MAKEIDQGKSLSERLTELRREQVHADMMVRKFKAEMDKWKQQVKSLDAQIAETIDEDTKPNLYTLPKSEKAGKVINVNKDGTVDVVKQGAAAAETIPVNETVAPVPDSETPAEEPKKKRGRKAKAAVEGEPAKEPSKQMDFPGPLPEAETVENVTVPIDPKNPPKPEGQAWKTLPIDGNLAGMKPQDYLALEEAGITNLGQLSAMIDSGLMEANEAISKAIADRARTSLQNYFINQA
jgi:hypothetical protein